MFKSMKESEHHVPYHKDTQQAYQAAQQGAQQAIDVYENLVPDDNPNYGNQLKHLKHEVNEAYQQITNALEISSETQRKRLEQFQHDLQQMVTEVNEP
jgi:hypothetical protein